MLSLSSGNFLPRENFSLWKKEGKPKEDYVGSLKDKIHLALEAKINEIFLKRLIQTLETSSKL